MFEVSDWLELLLVVLLVVIAEFIIYAMQHWMDKGPDEDQTGD